MDKDEQIVKLQAEKEKKEQNNVRLREKVGEGIDLLKRLLAKYETLQVDNKLLREYVKHKEDCPATRTFFIPECPHCGSRNNHWQSGGPAFEQYRVCRDCDGPTYIPEERQGECNCGLEKALKSR